MAMPSDSGVRLPVAGRRLAAGALVLLGLASAGVVEAAEGDGPVLVVEVDPAELDADALRAAIGDELGVAAVSPWDPRAPSSRGTLRVRVDEGKLEVEYEERHSISRRVTAPSSAAATAKAAAFLAGNLARHEASDLAGMLRPQYRWPTPAADTEAHDPSPVEAEPTRPEAPEFPRWWLGAWSEADAMTLDGTVHTLGSDGTTAEPASSNGPDGLALNGRLLVGADYAMSDHSLLGVHAGFMILRYPGPVGSGIDIGRFHLEARGTYLFGTFDRHLAPYAMSSLGVAHFDAEKDVALMKAWISRGPLFAAGGFGVRIPLSRSTAAMFAPFKFTVVFPQETGLAWSPEFAVSVGL